MARLLKRVLARPEMLTAIVLAAALLPREIGILGEVVFEELPFT